MKLEQSAARRTEVEPVQTITVEPVQTITPNLARATGEIEQTTIAARLHPFEKITQHPPGIRKTEAVVVVSRPAIQIPVELDCIGHVGIVPGPTGAAAG